MALVLQEAGTPIHESWSPCNPGVNPAGAFLLRPLPSQEWKIELQGGQKATHQGQAYSQVKAPRGMGGGAHLGKPRSLATGSTGIMCTGSHARTHKEALPNGYNLEFSSGRPQRPAPFPPENTGETAVSTTAPLLWCPTQCLQNHRVGYLGAAHTREGLEYGAPWPWMFDLYS